MLNLHVGVGWFLEDLIRVKTREVKSSPSMTSKKSQRMECIPYYYVFGKSLLYPVSEPSSRRADARCVAFERARLDRNRRKRRESSGKSNP
jgi:hypothetical protein